MGKSLIAVFLLDACASSGGEACRQRPPHTSSALNNPSCPPCSSPFSLFPSPTPLPSPSPSPSKKTAPGTHARSRRHARACTMKTNMSNREPWALRAVERRRMFRVVWRRPACQLAPCAADLQRGPKAVNRPLRLPRQHYRSGNQKARLIRKRPTYPEKKTYFHPLASRILLPHRSC